MLEGVKEAGQLIGSGKEIGSLFRKGADDARMFILGQVERIIVNLDSIRDSIDALDPRAERTLAAKSIAAGATELLLEQRQGYQLLLENISIVAAAATDVDIFIGSQGDAGFRKRISLAAGGRDSKEGLDLHAPEGSSIFASASSATQVNVQVRRDKVER